MLGARSTFMVDRAGMQVPTRRRTWPALKIAFRHPLRFLWQLASRVQDDGILTIAAAMAYYFFFSLFPLVLFVLALVSLAPVRGLEDWLLARAALFVPGEAYGLVERTIRSLLAQPRGGLLSVGAILALWTGSSAFVAVMGGLTRAYRVPEYRPWWRVRLQAIGLTIALSLFLIVTFVLTVFGGHLVGFVARSIGPVAGIAARVLRWAIVIGAVTVVVAAIDYACPATEPTWRWVTPGSVVFMLGFGGSSAAFSYYVGHVGSYDKTYGSLGAVIILLFWFYILAFFLLLGGEVNALLEEMARAAEAGGGVREGPERIASHGPGDRAAV